MSYLGRLSTRTASPTSGKLGALRPAIRSRSPIAEIDQRIGMANEAFDHISLAVGDESSRSVAAEFSTTSAPTSVNEHSTPTPDNAAGLYSPGEASAKESPSQGRMAAARTAGESVIDVEISTTKQDSKTGTELADRTFPSDPHQRSATIYKPSAGIERFRPQVVARPESSLSQGALLPEPTAPIESREDESAGGDQSSRQTLPADAFTKPRDIADAKDLMHQFESQFMAQPDAVNDEQSPALLEPKKLARESVATAAFSDLGESPPPRVVIDQLMIEVIPPTGATGQDQNQSQPVPGVTQAQPQAPVSQIGPLGNSVSAQVRFGLRHR